MARKTTQSSTEDNAFKDSRLKSAYQITNVRWGKDNAYAFFTLELPFGISLYSCKLVYKKDGTAFICPAQTKGSDGKYYNNYGLYLDESMEKDIIEQLEGM